MIFCRCEGSSIEIIGNIEKTVRLRQNPSKMRFLLLIFCRCKGSSIEIIGNIEKTVSPRQNPSKMRFSFAYFSFLRKEK